MKVVQQKLHVPIFTGSKPLENENNYKHNELFPNSIRCIIAGPSNCGKTTALISLLLSENGLKFENLYIFSKSFFQPIYQYLYKVLQNVKEIDFKVFEQYDDLIEPQDSKLNSVFVFDDVAWEAQTKIQSYFSMGRHRNIDVFYLTQSYARLPKHLLRDNASMLVIFKQDNLNLKHIWEDHLISDISYDDFKKLCEQCWKEKNGFLVVAKDCGLGKGRFRLGFDKYISDW